MAICIAGNTAYDRNVTGEVTMIRENPAFGNVTLATRVGRRTSLTRGNGTVTTYDYDNASRLEQLDNELAGPDNDLTLDFTHNPAGQIHTAARDNDAFSFLPANVNITDSINGLNQITQTGATNVTHDGRGNISAIGTGAFAYTSENRLATRTNPSAWIGYDALGRLLSTSGPTYTIFEHVGDRLVTERANVTFAVVRRYVHGPGVEEPLVWYEGSGTSTRRWFHADERGSIVAVSDSNGNLVGTRNRYDEYGVPQGTLTGRFGFTGQAWVPELGLYYYRARMYNPALGRFMQTDPIGYGGSMNLYAYVRNDPVNLIDPSGLRWRRRCVLIEGKSDCGWFWEDDGESLALFYSYGLLFPPGAGFGAPDSGPSVGTEDQRCQSALGRIANMSAQYNLPFDSEAERILSALGHGGPSSFRLTDYGFGLAASYAESHRGNVQWTGALPNGIVAGDLNFGGGYTFGLGGDVSPLAPILGSATVYFQGKEGPLVGVATAFDYIPSGAYDSLTGLGVSRANDLLVQNCPNRQSSIAISGGSVP